MCAISSDDHNAADPGSVRVLLVEDERSIAEPFVAALRRAGFDAQLALSASEALVGFGAHPPDVVLLDLGLPDMDGRELCRAIRAQSDVPIIMITASGTVADRIVGLELGADDYVVKPFAAGEVIARIRAILRRGRPAQEVPKRFEVRDLVIDQGARRVWRAGAELELTRKEFDLLARLAADAGRVVSREDLMADVWDTNWFGSTKTLDVHIGWLRRKLGDDPDAPAYIRTVRGVGFELTVEEPQ